MARKGDIAARGAERVGDIQAQGARQQGSLVGGTIASIGQSLAAIPAQQQKAKADALQLKGQQLQVDTLQRQADDLKALDAAYAQPGGRAAVLNALPGHLRPQVAAAFEASDKAHLESQKLRDEADKLSTESIADLGATVRDYGYDPKAAQLAISDFKLKYANDPQRLQQIKQVEARLHDDPTPETVKALVDPLIALSPKRREEAAKAAELAQKTKNEDQIRADTQTSAAETARHNAELERIAGLTAGRQDAAAAETARHNRATEAHAAATDDNAPNLSPEAIALTAKQFAMTGQLPPMGMGKQGAKVRTDIINAAAKEYAGLDLASQKAAYEGLKESQKKLEVQRQSVGAFESTAIKNLKVFLDAADKIPDTGMPFLNTPLRKLDERLLGDPKMSAYNTALRTVIPEFAKILSNPSLSGHLSDSARKEIEDVVQGGGATMKQLKAIASTLVTDAENRRSSLDEQIAGVQKLIAGPPAGTKPAAGNGDPLGIR